MNLKSEPRIKGMMHGLKWQDMTLRLVSFLASSAFKEEWDSWTLGTLQLSRPTHNHSHQNPNPIHGIPILSKESNFFKFLLCTSVPYLYICICNFCSVPVYHQLEVWLALLTTPYFVVTRSGWLFQEQLAWVWLLVCHLVCLVLLGRCMDLFTQLYPFYCLVSKHRVRNCSHVCAAYGHELIGWHQSAD